MKLKRKEDGNVNTSALLRRGNKIHGRNYIDKVWSIDKGNDHPKSVPLGDLSHIQPPNYCAYQQELVDRSPIKLSVKTERAFATA